MKRRLSLSKFVFFAVFFVLSPWFSGPVQAQDHSEERGKLNISEVIIEHVMDHHVWHFFDGHYGTLFLPVIVYSPDQGLAILSSRHFFDEYHQHVAYNGYTIEHNKIYLS